MKKILLLLWIASLPALLTAQQLRSVEGTVTGPDGNPLEGATVMFIASPVHTNTGIDGKYHLSPSVWDTGLMVYYPGMKFFYYTFQGNETVIDIQLETDPRDVYVKPAVRSTPWFDPADDHPVTYCNPMNISYNFEPYNNNVKPSGSFRSSADPMITVYKDEYYLFSTNQGGFHYSKDLANWEFVFTGFQRYPDDDDLCAPAALVMGNTLFIPDLPTMDFLYGTVRILKAVNSNGTQL